MPLQDGTYQGGNAFKDASGNIIVTPNNVGNGNGNLNTNSSNNGNANANNAQVRSACKLLPRAELDRVG